MIDVLKHKNCGGELQDYTPVDREEYGVITVCLKCKKVIDGL